MIINTLDWQNKSATLGKPSPKGETLQCIVCFVFTVNLEREKMAQNVPSMYQTMSQNKFCLPCHPWLCKYFHRRCRSSFDKGQGRFVRSDLIRSHCYIAQYNLARQAQPNSPLTAGLWHVSPLALAGMSVCSRLVQ